MSLKLQPTVLALYGCLMLSLAGHSSARRPAGHAARPATPPASGVSAGVRRAIQSLYGEQNAAFSRQDIEGYLAHRAPNYVMIDKGGAGPGQDKLRKSVGVMFQGTKASSATTTILSASAEGGGVVVVTREHLQMTVVRPGDHQVGHLVADGRSRDFWVQGQDGWQEMRSKQLSSTETLNGQPLR